MQTQMCMVIRGYSLTVAARILVVKVWYKDDYSMTESASRQQNLNKIYARALDLPYHEIRIKNCELTKKKKFCNDDIRTQKVAVY